MPLLVLCFVSFFILTACSFDTAEKTVAPPPGVASKPSKPASSAAAKPSPFDALKALSPPQGLKSTTLFGEPVGDAGARFERLETSVQKLRDDLDVAAPTIVRLAAVEKDMKNLIRQLETLAAAPVAAPAVAVDAEALDETELSGEEMVVVADGGATDAGTPAPLPPLPLSNSGEKPKLPVKETPLQGKPAGQPTTQTEESKPPAVATQQPPAGASLHTIPPAPQQPPPAPPKEVKKETQTQTQTQIREPVFHVLKWRLGEHPDKTRMVFELSGKVNYTVKIENGQLIVDFPDAAWDQAREWTTDSAPLVYAYRVEETAGDGLRVKFDLLYDAGIVYQKMFPAADGTPAKLVIDLKSATIHR